MYIAICVPENRIGLGILALKIAAWNIPLRLDVLMLVEFAMKIPKGAHGTRTTNAA